MSDPPEDAPDQTGTPTLPKIPWPILLRYHLRKALQWRPSRAEAADFEFENQFGNACLHFAKAYLWIMFPLALGLFLGAHALQWDGHTFNWMDPGTWPYPLELLEVIWDNISETWLGILLLPLSLPIMMLGTPLWLYLIYLPILIAWYFTHITPACEPNHARWVPGITALQAWVVVFRKDGSYEIMTWFLLISYTATAALLTAYLGWWRPRRLLHEIDTERDLVREDRMDEAMTEQAANSEPP